jgi:hypothetical protein
MRYYLSPYSSFAGGGFWPGTAVVKVLFESRSIIMTLAVSGSGILFVFLLSCIMNNKSRGSLVQASPEKIREFVGNGSDFSAVPTSEKSRF